METYKIDGISMDSIELKCLLISRGVKVDSRVYKELGGKKRINQNPLTCNCLILPDGTIVQMTDLAFHISYLKGALSWDTLKMLRTASSMTTPFSVSLTDGVASLYHKDQFVCRVDFPKPTDFYAQKTSSGLPILGNAVIQGTQWVAFQCLWPCDYACAGESCQFCYSGGVAESLSKRGKPLPAVPTSRDVAEIIKYSVDNVGCTGVQLTGGSTFDSAAEAGYIRGYMEAINSHVGRRNITGEILLYITPPENNSVVDEYFALGVDRIACSIEVWDETLAAEITPGKIKFTSRKRHLDALTYIAQKFGPGKAFSNFVIGLESVETLGQGAEYLASRGIIPSASVWIPFGRPVQNSMETKTVEYYRRVKELLAELYVKYKLEPAGENGLNVCIERDIWKYAYNKG